MPLSANAWSIDHNGHLQTDCGKISGVLDPSFFDSWEEAQEYYTIIVQKECPSDKDVQQKPANPDPEAPNP